MHHLKALLKHTYFSVYHPCAPDLIKEGCFNTKFGNKVYGARANCFLDIKSLNQKDAISSPVVPSSPFCSFCLSPNLPEQTKRCR